MSEEEEIDEEGNTTRSWSSHSCILWKKNF